MSSVRGVVECGRARWFAVRRRAVALLCLLLAALACPASTRADEAIESSENLLFGKRPIRIRREVPGHVANRMQVALYREAIHLVLEEVASIADVDAAIAYGPGLRWAFMGPHMAHHLAGGRGGRARLSGPSRRVGAGSERRGLGPFERRDPRAARRGTQSRGDHAGGARVAATRVARGVVVPRDAGRRLIDLSTALRTRMLAVANTHRATTQAVAEMLAHDRHECVAAAPASRRNQSLSLSLPESVR